jgi:hypothetical protein
MLNLTNYEAAHCASCLQTTIVFCRLGPDIVLNTLLSSVCYSLSVRDQVSHTYTTTVKTDYSLYKINRKML